MKAKNGDTEKDIEKAYADEAAQMGQLSYRGKELGKKSARTPERSQSC